jgi:hypothetical protein
MAAVRTSEVVVSSTNAHKGRCGMKNTKQMHFENAYSSGAFLSNLVRNVVCYDEGIKNISSIACQTYHTEYMPLAHAFPLTRVADKKTIFLINFLRSNIKKGINCPATRHGGVWGGRRYSSYSFLTSALDGGEWSASRPGRALPPGKDLQYPLDIRLGGPQSRSGRRG